MIIKILGLDKDFLESAKFLEKKENIEIKKYILIKGKEISKLRANLNLILRCLKMYEDIKKWLEK